MLLITWIILTAAVGLVIYDGVRIAELNKEIKQLRKEKQK